MHINFRSIAVGCERRRGWGDRNSSAEGSKGPGDDAQLHFRESILRTAEDGFNEARLKGGD